MVKIYIACDHGGFALKQHLVNVLQSGDNSVEDLGTHTPDTSVDYPDYANALAHKMKGDTESFGVLVCGSGVGISISANRHKHIRCALVSDAHIARLSREHNNANVIALGGRFIDSATATDIVDTFLNTAFHGGRHIKRIEKMCSGI